MSVESPLSARQLLQRTGISQGRLRPAELERWLEREGLAEIRDGRVIPTARAVGLVDSLRVTPRGGVRRRGSRIA